MPEKKVKDLLKKFIEELSQDVSEERVLNYIIRELHLGRSLKSIIQDNYIKNRVNEEKLAHILENPEVIDAVEAEINKAFATKDCKFRE